LKALNDPDVMKLRLLKTQRLSEGFKRAHDRGMVIHCLDDRKNLEAQAIQGLLDVTLMMQAHMFKKYGVEKPLHGKHFIKALFENANQLIGPEKIDKSKVKGFLLKRSDDDKALGERMLKAAGDDMGATLFGAGHAKDEDGLFDTLGQDTTLRVDLYSSRDFYADRLFAGRKNGIEPHYIHVLDEDRLFRVRNFG
jgi:hypothetical protein